MSVSLLSRDEVELALDELTALLRRYGEGTALRTPTGDVTYRELADEVATATHWLARAVPGAASRIALSATQDPKAMAIFLAAQMRGAAVLLLDPRTRPDERSRALAAFGGGALVESGEIAASEEISCPAMAPDGPAIGLQTSGVQGDARLVQRSWPSVIDNARLWGSALRLTPGERVLCTTNWHHSYGLGSLLASLIAGACFILPRRPASPDAVRNAARADDCAVFLSVPVLYEWYASTILPEISPRLCISAGDALPAHVARSWRDAGREIREHYGSSELGMVTMDERGVPGSVGTPLPGIRARLATDMSADEVASRADFPDELCISPRDEGPVLIDVNGAARSGLSPDGWFVTGDLAVIDADGAIFLSGRTGNVINVGANKVRAEDVERAMLDLTQVKDAVVVGRAARSGEQIWAYVTGHDEIDTASLRRLLTENLRPVQVPAVIRQVRELPRTASGKVRRSVVRQWALKACDPDQGAT